MKLHPHVGFLSKDERNFLGEHLMLIRASAVLRLGAASEYSALRERMEWLEGVLGDSNGPLSDDVALEAARHLKDALSVMERVTSQANQVVTEAGYIFDFESGHLLNPKARRGRTGSAPQHFRGLVWDVFNRMYPQKRKKGDYSMNTAGARERIRGLLEEYFPEAWLDTRPKGRLSQILEDGMAGKITGDR